LTDQTRDRPVSVLTGLAFGEGPRWHDDKLHLSDMHSHEVLVVEVDGNPRVEVIARHSSPVSGLGWLPGGQLLVVAMDGSVLRLEDGSLVEHADLRPHAAFGINDMIVHPQGWAYVGQFGYDRHSGGRPAPADLLRVDRGGEVMVAAEGLMVANGMAISADGQQLLVAESAGQRISAFAIGPQGDLSDRRTFAELPARHAPDGMCLDAEGAVWVASVTTGSFLRMRPGGEVVDEISLDPGRVAIACVLGGRARQDLFLLTAETHGEAERSEALRSSCVLSVAVDVPGAGWP
jgi:sugar lactone lactonase YvrE